MAITMENHSINQLLWKANNAESDLRDILFAITLYVKQNNLAAEERCLADRLNDRISNLKTMMMAIVADILMQTNKVSSIKRKTSSTIAEERATQRPRTSVGSANTTRSLEGPSISHAITLHKNDGGDNPKINANQTSTNKSSEADTTSKSTEEDMERQQDDTSDADSDIDEREQSIGHPSNIKSEDPFMIEEIILNQAYFDDMECDSDHSIAVSNDDQPVNADFSKSPVPSSSRPRGPVPTVIKLLSDILNDSGVGKNILSVYATKGELRAEHRKLLVDLIFQYHFAAFQMPMSLETIESYSRQISEIFPKEVQYEYYIPRTLNSNPKGKLYNFQRNTLKKMKNCGFYSIKSAPPKYRRREKKPEAKPEPATVVFDAQYREVESWLKYDYKGAEWEEVLLKYKSISPARLHHFRQSDFAEIMLAWEVLKSPNAHDLVNIDFDYLHPGCFNSMLDNWKLFESNVFSVLEEEVKDKAARKLLQTVDDSDSEDSRNLIALTLIHHILKPTVNIPYAERDGKKSFWRVSIADSQTSQIVLLDNCSRIKELIEQRTLKYSGTGLKLQPFIIAVGDSMTTPTEFYVYLNNWFYKFDSVVKALDFCFKLFHVFNLSYPRESALVWNFIQTFLYKMPSRFDIADNIRIERFVDALTLV